MNYATQLLLKAINNYDSKNIQEQLEAIKKAIDKKYSIVKKENY